MFPPSVCTTLHRQAGVVTRPQLLMLACSEGTIEGWVRRGRLEVCRFEGVPLVGTYRVPGGGVPRDQHLVAAALRCRPRAWIAGPAVLALLGFEGYSVTDEFIVLVPPGRMVCNVPFTIVADPLYDQHRARCGAVPIAGPVRSIVEATRWVSGTPLRTTVDYARWKGLVNIGDLRRCAVILGVDHTAELVTMINDGIFEQDSEGERRLKPILAGLEPPPLWQYHVTPNRRVDCLLADVPLVLEYLGDVAHAQPHQRARDHGRNRELEALGFVVHEIVASDLATPDVLRATILGLRAGLLSAGARLPHLRGA